MMTTVVVVVVALSVVIGLRLRYGASRGSMVGLKRTVLCHRVIGVCALLLTAFLPGFAYAHGKVTIEEDSCVRRVGGNLIHLNAYQPHNEAKAQYCTEIPGEGETFLVVDLVDAGLRNTAVGVRVVRGLNEAAEDQTVAYWPPAIHPDGVVRGETTLAKGLYTLIVSPEGLSSSSYVLRVQQADYTQLARKSIGPLAILLLLALIGYEFSKSNRFRNWRVSGPA
ncbi:MAG: hypothetical protein KF693_13645 [Nitrospira sp.]|nr:hypothetical protein [Nitrospira sp.]